MINNHFHTKKYFKYLFFSTKQSLQLISS